MISFSVLIEKHPSKADTGNIPKSKKYRKGDDKKNQNKKLDTERKHRRTKPKIVFKALKPERKRDMEYQDFLELAVYGNEQWNGFFTQEEVTENAETYYSDFLFSKKTGKTTEIITELLRLLQEDGEEQASNWKRRIEKELNL